MIFGKCTPNMYWHRIWFVLMKSMLDGPFGNLSIGIGIDVGTVIGIVNKYFFLAKFLILPFEVSYEEKIYGEVLFKYPCTPSWEFQPLFRAVIL